MQTVKKVTTSSSRISIHKSNLDWNLTVNHRMIYEELIPELFTYRNLGFWASLAFEV